MLCSLSSGCTLLFLLGTKLRLCKFGKEMRRERGRWGCYMDKYDPKGYGILATLIRNRALICRSLPFTC